MTNASIAGSGLAALLLFCGCGDDTTGGLGGSGGNDGGSGGLATAGGNSVGGAPGGGGTGGVVGGAGGTAPAIDGLCAGPTIDTFGDFSGPTTTDSAGNVFSAAYLLADETEVRGYDAAAALGAMGATGTAMLSTPGSGSQLAALAPSGGEDGQLVFAGYSGNPQRVAYTSDANGIAVVGEPVTLATIDSDFYGVALAATDSAIWLGVTDSGIDTTFAVLERTSSSPTCLAAVDYENTFSLPVDSPFCVTGLHLAADMAFATPTVGRHGGLLTATPSASIVSGVDIHRWSVPATSTEALTRTTTSIDLGIQGDVNTDYFYNPTVVDTPFIDWTVVSYTNMDFTGELVLVDGTDVVNRYPSYGIFSIGAAASGANSGRVFINAQSGIMGTAFDAQALYTADSCASN